MPIYTSNYLKSLSQNKTLSERTRLFAASQTTHSSFDIFLSHCLLDRDEVEGIYIELTRMAYTVYVDWIVDPQLDRKNVTKKSATLIRNRMKSSRSLLLGISSNATTSKWIPWELGYVDGHCGRCAILPVSNQSSNVPRSYTGVEYLSLYPFVRRVPVKRGGEELFVIEDALDYVLFKDWLSGSTPQRKEINIFSIP